MEMSVESGRKAIEMEQAAAQARQVATRDFSRWFYEDCCTPLVGAHPLLADLGFDAPPYLGLRVDSGNGIIFGAYVRNEIEAVVRLSDQGEHEVLGNGGRQSLNGAYYEMPRAGASVTIVTERFVDGLICLRAVPNSRVLLWWGWREPDRYGGMRITTQEPWAERWKEGVRKRGLLNFRRHTRYQIRQAMDAEIKDALMREARWMP